MYWLLKETLFLLLAFLDAEFTKRRLFEDGVEQELNPIIRWLCSKVGIRWGVELGILVPTALLSAIGWYQSDFLAFLLGVRFFLFLLQCRTRNGTN